MLQALLKERFKLTFHIEKKEMESYVLVVGKQGAKLKASLPDPPKSDPDAPLKPGESYVGEGDAKSKMTVNPDGSRTMTMNGRTSTFKFDMESWSNHFEDSKMTMMELASRLGGCLGSREGNKVDDQTGLKGDFQVAFDCPMPGRNPTIHNDASDSMPSDPQGGGSLNKSLDAMGLKLEKRKVQMDIYVIDHVEKPSEN